jgi:starch phosphorylase
MHEIAPLKFEKEIIDELKFTMARDQVTASRREWWIATSMAVQRLVIGRMMKTLAVHNEQNVRRV